MLQMILCCDVLQYIVYFYALLLVAGGNLFLMNIDSNSILNFLFFF